MEVFGQLHGSFVHPRRVRVLASMLAPLLPPGRILDVGCGDGLLTRALADARPDATVEGVDVLVRPGALVPVRAFDGVTLPFSDGEFAATVCVDVVHHADDPLALLREAARVSRVGVIVKDHTLDGWLAGPTLRFMDRVGNARHGVYLPYHYWPSARWRSACAELGLTATFWTGRVPIYPWWAAWVFGRSLHFVARLEKPA